MAEEVELLTQGQEAAVSQMSPTVLAAAREQGVALELVFVRGLVLDSEREQGVSVVPPWVP